MKRLTDKLYLIGAMGLIVLQTLSDCSAAETDLSKGLFSKEEIKEAQRASLVGRLSLKRKFLGTRSTPSFEDQVEFHFLNGEPLKFLSFKFSNLGESISEKLLAGHSLPVMLDVFFQRREVGHDGINHGVRFIPTVESYSQTTAYSLCKTALTKGFSEQECERFKNQLKPAFSNEDFAVSLGIVSAKSKVSRRGVPLSVQGINVYNKSPKAVQIEILDVTVKQGKTTQSAAQSKRIKGPLSWDVPANSWADGKYEAGKMPGKLWAYDIEKPILAETPVTLVVKMRLNNGEAFTVQKTVAPE